MRSTIRHMKIQKRVNIIKTYYLIDFENVGCEGFKGCGKLSGTDFIHLFYTDNSRKIDLDIINDHGESKLITHKVPTGNQSADMHLGSYLGYLIGKECAGQDEECKFVVISKDTGFDHIIEFWKAEKGVKISRSEKISGKQVQTRKQVKKLTDEQTDGQTEEQPDQKIEKQTEEQSDKQPVKQSGDQNAKQPKQKKTVKQTQKIIDMNAGVKKLQQELVQILDKAGMPKEVVNYVSTTVEKNAEGKNRKQQIYRSIISKYGQTKGLNIYNHIKKRI